MFDSRLQEATAWAPATVSNVGVGFDILGFGLSPLGDEVTVRRTADPGVHLVILDGDERVPVEPEDNSATAGLMVLLEDRPMPFGLEVELKKGVPVQSGLGGTAASAVAAITAASAVLEEPLGLPERFHYALLGERMACGRRGGDNVAPAMLGGMVLVRSMDPLDVVRIPVPHQMGAVVVRPELCIDVRKARQLLADQIEMKQFVRQSANLAGFLAGCFRDDRNLIGRSLQDLIVGPQRAHMIPGFAEVQEAARGAGALGCSIAGAGPTLFALHDFDVEGEAIRDAMIEAFQRAGIESTGHLSPINGLGAHIVGRG